MTDATATTERQEWRVTWLRKYNRMLSFREDFGDEGRARICLEDLSTDATNVNVTLQTRRVVTTAWEDVAE